MRAHLSINVRSLKKSIAFYSKIFGVKPQKRSATYAKFDLREPSLNFSMHECADGRKPSQVNHLGIEVMSEKEVTQWLKKVGKCKIKTLVEEASECCFALQDKFWFEDPDGNSWEVFFVHKQLPVAGAEPPGAVAKVSKDKKVTGVSKSGCC